MSTLSAVHMSGSLLSTIAYHAHTKESYYHHFQGSCRDFSHYLNRCVCTAKNSTQLQGVLYGRLQHRNIACDDTNPSGTTNSSKLNTTLSLVRVDFCSGNELSDNSTDQKLKKHNADLIPIGRIVVRRHCPHVLSYKDHQYLFSSSPLAAEGGLTPPVGHQQLLSERKILMLVTTGYYSEQQNTNYVLGDRCTGQGSDCYSHDSQAIAAASIASSYDLHYSVFGGEGGANNSQATPIPIVVENLVSSEGLFRDLIDTHLRHCPLLSVHSPTPTQQSISKETNDDENKKENNSSVVNVYLSSQKEAMKQSITEIKQLWDQATSQKSQIAEKWQLLQKLRREQKVQP